MSIQELNHLETEIVSGAGTLIGDTLQNASNLFSSTLNVQAPIWKPLSLIPGVGTVHQAIDVGFLAISEGLYRAGTLLGGDQDQVKFHYDNEKGDGTYNPLGIFKGIVR